MWDLKIPISLCERCKVIDKVKLKNNVGKLERPCIVLCNHGSFFDFVFAGKMLLTQRPQFIVARMYFHNKKLGWIISKTGAFPKSLFSTDLENSKNCMKVINAGNILAMMPEAQLSTDGRFTGIQEATYKFVQKMNVPVYTVKIQGAYLTKPKWGDKARKGGLVEAELNKLFDKGEVQNLSLQEIQTRVEDALKFDAILFSTGLAV